MRDGASLFPIHYAADKGHIDCVSAILSVPNQSGLFGLRSAAGIARSNGYQDIVELLEKAMETCVTDYCELLYC